MGKNRKLFGLMLVAVFVLSLVGVRFGPSIVEAWDKMKTSIHTLEVYKIQPVHVKQYPLEIINPAIISGVTKFTQDAIVLNALTPFSTWSGTATAGQSYWQADAGKRYIVDPHAMYVARPTLAGAVAFSGVSIILPQANAANDEATVTVEYAITGATGYPALSVSGTTLVTVWPYAGAGATAYGVAHQGGVTIPQTLLTKRGTATKNMASGASYWMLAPGESVTFVLKNSSQVSAYPKERDEV